jgi:predicted amidohydrolase
MASTDSVEAGFATYGHAMAVTPWGEVMADLGETDFAVKVLELDMAKVAQIRQNLPVLDSVQPDVYTTEPVVI